MKGIRVSCQRHLKFGRGLASERLGASKFCLLGTELEISDGLAIQRYVLGKGNEQ